MSTNPHQLIPAMISPNMHTISTDGIGLKWYRPKKYPEVDGYLWKTISNIHTYSQDDQLFFRYKQVRSITSAQEMLALEASKVAPLQGTQSQNAGVGTCLTCFTGHFIKHQPRYTDIPR